MKMSKLSKTQQELYEAMRAGAICFYMPYMGRFRPNAYYFRNDTNAHCSTAARALLKKGLVELFEKEKYSGSHKLRVKSASDETPTTPHQ